MVNCTYSFDSLFKLGVAFCLILGNPLFAQKKTSKLGRNPEGHWTLSGSASDLSKNQLPTNAHGTIIYPKDGKGATFNGMDSWLEVPASATTFPGDNDFSIAAWINVNNQLKDVPGDLISRYDAHQKKGFHFSIKSSASPTSQSNYRQLTFGIDDDRSSGWVDYGRPGNALLAFGLTEHKGELYAGICQTEPDETGKVYKYDGKKGWIDCGAPDRSNSVMALASFNGELFAATGHYRIGGSSLPESENKVQGGRVFKYKAPNQWEEIGNLQVECIGAMAIYNGKLYASSMYSPGLFRYDGENKWVSGGSPDNKRVVNLATYNDYLYATSWDHGHIYRFDGSKWENCGPVGDNTQNYAFNIYEGNLYTATWPSGRVFRFDGLHRWTDVGRLGEEMEVMAMMTHNGQMLAGTLPLAEVYQYAGDTLWHRMDQLDKTPDVRYRRAWTMAEHGGIVFCSTLPSGHIFGYEAGKSVSMKENLPEGWQHVAAIKTATALRLYLNGNLVAEQKIDPAIPFNLTTNTPIKIGFGSNDYFNGGMRDLRIYRSAISERELKLLLKQ